MDSDENSGDSDTLPTMMSCASHAMRTMSLFKSKSVTGSSPSKSPLGRPAGVFLAGRVAISHRRAAAVILHSSSTPNAFTGWCRLF